jgi:multidrug efflux system membrane fusion protein
MRKSYIWAGVIVLAVGGWLASPRLMPMIQGKAPEPAAGETAGTAATETVAAKPFKVRVKTFKAELRQATVSAHGTTEASKRIEVRARTNGVIIDQPLQQGAEVKAGDKLCGLDMMNREAQLAQAEAALASAQRDYDASENLAKNGFVADAKLAAQKAGLDAALAALEQIKWDIAQMTIVAPAAGVLIDKPAEAGSLLGPGGLCATISVIDPIVVSTQVSEQYVSYLAKGMAAKAKLATGEDVDGKVRFIALASDLSTRTFKVELEVPNPGNRLRAGVSADIYVPLPPVSAQFLPSSILGLNDKGQFGVRVLNGDNTTTFTEVKVIAQDHDGAWVAGLPAAVTLVVVGQDYVKDGEKVEPVAEVASNAS